MIGMDAKAVFDIAAVMRRKARAQRRVMFKTAAGIRTRARRKIRKRKRSSNAGEAPSGHGSQPYRNAIMFAVERGGQSSVIGPTLRNSGDASTIEKGGVVYKRIRGRVVRIKYEPRPVMAPTLDDVRDDLPTGWAGVV